jgi:dGTPase
MAALKPRSAEDVRRAPKASVGFSAAMEKADADIKGFLRPRMYRHARVMRIMGEAEGVVRDLFTHYARKPTDLPVEWAEGIDPRDEAARYRHIADFIAGMTDRYALIEHARHFAKTPELN